jgi:hypothetical protein
MENSENLNNSEEFPSKNPETTKSQNENFTQENSQGSAQGKPILIQRTGQQGFRVGVEKSTGKKVLILQVEEGIQNQNISEGVFFHFRDAKPEDFGFTS